MDVHKMKSSEFLIGKRTGNQRASDLLIGKRRMSDKDRDGVPNIFDCKPNDPKRDSLLGDIARGVKNIISPPKPTPAPQPTKTVTIPLPPSSLPKSSPATPTLPAGSPIYNQPSKPVSKPSLPVSRPSGGGGGGGGTSGGTIPLPQEPSKPSLPLPQQPSKPSVPLPEPKSIPGVSMPSTKVYGPVQLTPQERALQEFAKQSQATLPYQQRGTLYGGYPVQVQPSQKPSGFGITTSSIISPSATTQIEYLGSKKEPLTYVEDYRNKDYVKEDIYGTGGYSRSIQPSEGFKVKADYYTPSGYVQATQGSGLIEGAVKIITYPQTKLSETIKVPETPEVFKTEFKSPGTAPYQQRGTATTSYVYKGIEGQTGRERIVTESLQVNKIQNEINQFGEEIVNKYSKEIQGKIKSGEIKDQTQLDSAINKYNKEMESELNKVAEPLIKKYELDVTQREKERIKSLAVGLAKERSLITPETVLSMGLYAVPYYGGTLFAAETYKSVKERGALQTGKELAIMAPFALVGGKVISKIKGTREASKIREAMLEGKVVNKEAGVIIESEIGRLNLSKDMQIELQKYLEAGYTVRRYDTELIPKAGLEDLTPKVKGKFLEVTTKEGNVVERFGVGDVSATYKGKKVDQLTLSQGISKIEQETGKIKGYAEIVVAKRQPSFDLLTGRFSEYKKPTLTKYKEETTLTSFKKIPAGRAIETETITSLIGNGGKRYKGQGLLEGYGKRYGETPMRILPDFDLITGKPVSKTVQREVQILREAELEAKKYPSLKYKQTKTYQSAGAGITTFIKETPKKKVPSRAWDFQDTFKEGTKPKIEPKTTEELITSYHGTDIFSAQRIAKEGLLPGSKAGVSRRFSGYKLEEVYTTPEKEWAKGWANMAVYGKGKISPGNKPVVLEVTMPKKVFEKSLIKRGTEKGGAEEFTFRKIEPKYIKILKEEAKPKAPTLREGYPTIVGGTGTQGDYTSKSGQVLVGGVSLKGAEAVEARGLLSREMTLASTEGFAKEFAKPSEFSIFRESTKPGKFAPSIKLETESKVSLSGASLLAPSLLISESLKEKEKEKLKESTASKQISFTFAGEATSLMPGEALAQPQIQRQQQVLRTGQKMKQITGQVPGFGFKFDYTPEPVKIRIPLKEDKKPVKKKKTYFALSKRYGKVGVVGIAETPQQAKQKAQAFALTTLGASAGISTSEGKIIPISATQGFGYSKTMSGFLTQRRGLRLSSVSERKEIALAKKGVRQFL